MTRKDSSKPVFPIGQPPATSQRPSMIPLGKTDYLFHDVGSTGWRHKRDISEHKGEKVEGDFHHLYDKFTHDTEA